jgi:hypothetical protein
MKSVCENFNIPFKHFSLHIFFESTFDIHREFYEHFPIIIDDQCPLQLQQLKDKLDIERLLFISNQRNVPTRTLQALLSSLSHPISAYRLQQTKKELDSQLDRLFPLLSFSPSVDCAYLSPVNLLQTIALYLSFTSQSSIWEIVFSGDGRMLHNQSSVALNLKSLHDPSLCYSLKSIFPFFLFRGSEKYEHLKLIMTQLSPLLFELKNSTIFFHLPLLPLTPNLRFCSDGKFLNLILGLQSANATFNCPFCLVSKKMWGLIISGKIDSNLFLRKSISELSKMKDPSRPCPAHLTIEKCLQSDHEIKNENVCLISGLFDLENIVIDELHLFARLSDLIMNRLLNYVESFGIENDLEKISRSLGINFHCVESVFTKEGFQAWSNLTFTQTETFIRALVKLQDDDNMCLLNKIFFVQEREMFIRTNHIRNRPKAIRNHYRYYDCIKRAFISLLEIIDYLREKPSQITSNTMFKNFVLQFAKELYACYDDVSSGWYLHVLISHVPFMLERFGSIKRFSCSPQELMNGQHSKTNRNCSILYESSYHLLRKIRRDYYFYFIKPEVIESIPTIKYPKKRTSMPLTFH